MTSTCLGLLIDDRKCTLDTLAKDYLPAMAETYPKVTLRHFATMTSGYRAIGDEPLDRLFKRRIADPVDMDASEWRWGDFGDVDGLRINGGSGNGGKHVFISARQMARLGWLFLHRGKWNGRQVISSAWVDRATSVQASAATPQSKACLHVRGQIEGGWNYAISDTRPIEPGGLYRLGAWYC